MITVSLGAVIVMVILFLFGWTCGVLSYFFSRVVMKKKFITNRTKGESK